LRGLGVPAGIFLCAAALFGGTVCHAQQAVEQHRLLMREALQHQDLSKVRAMLKTPYVDPNGSYTDSRVAGGRPVTFLSAAAGTGNPELVQAFFDAGATVLAGTPPSSLSPLFLAARSRSAQVRHMLVEHAREKESATPEEWHNFLNRRDPVTQNTVLVECLAGSLPAGPATTDYDCLTEFTGSVDPNLGDSEGHTPLWHAARLNDERAVRVLIAGGANVDIRDKWGRTALMDSLTSGGVYGVTPIYKLLIENSRNLMLRDSCGLTAFDRLESVPVEGMCRERSALEDFASAPLRTFMLDHGAERRPLPQLYQCGRC
jgi:hypothetical protein